MPDRKLTFLNSMVNQSTSTMWVFACLSLLLLSVGATLFYKGSADLSIDKTIPLIISIFSAVPAPIAVLAGNKKAYYVYLRDSWQDATASANQENIQHLADRIEKLQDLVADKGLGIIKI